MQTLLELFLSSGFFLQEEILSIKDDLTVIVQGKTKHPGLLQSNTEEQEVIVLALKICK